MPPVGTAHNPCYGAKAPGCPATVLGPADRRRRDQARRDWREYEASGPSGSVAIKLLSQASLGNPKHELRFLRELRTAAAIEAPNVVKVLDVGQQPSVPRDGEPRGQDAVGHPAAVRAVYPSALPRTLR